MLASLKIVRAARPILRGLRDATGRTVSQAVLDGTDVVYLQRLCGFERGQYSLEQGIGAGLRRPARHTAAGKALLASLGETGRRGSRRIGPAAPIVDSGGLRSDARGIAITVHAEHHTNTAIEITVPTDAISKAELTDQLSQPLLAAGAALQDSLAEDRGRRSVRRRTGALGASMGGDDEDRAPARSFPTLPASRYSQSLERGLAILACFTPERPVLGIAEIAGALGMSRATTHRYVSTLAKQGYLQQDASSKYRLSLGAMDLGMAALNATGLCTHARPDLEALAQRSGYTVELAVLDGLEILLLDSVISTRSRLVKTDLNTEAGSRLPAYSTSMGKVLLAYLPAEQQLRRLSETQLTKRGPKTITSEKLLRRQLEEVQEAGLAVNDEESVADTCAIAAPVRDESADVVAAVSVVAHHWVTDIEGLVDWLEGQLVLTAERISKRLGWEGEDE